MGDKNDLQSPLRRAKLGMYIWIELLPKEAQEIAVDALTALCTAAEREIEQAYFDGQKHRSSAIDSRQFRAPPPQR
jgi:hypothetical protein